MCKKLYVTDLKVEKMVNQQITETFFIKKVTREGNGDKEWLSVVCSDRMGDISGKVWGENINDTFFALAEKLVKVTATVGNYRGYYNLNITNMVETNISKYEPSDFAECVDDIDAQYNAFIDMYHADIKDPKVIELLDTFYKNEKCVKKIKSLQGAKAIHHVRVGGYLEHITSVYNDCKQTAQRYLLHPDFSMDCLLAGAALHDIGKVYEYKPLPLNQRTDLGIMVGHLALSFGMVYKVLTDITDFPEDIKIKLLHCLITSHGEHDRIVKPSCVEALILHSADERDARIDGFNMVIATDTEPGNMSKYNPIYDQYIYKK